jgi:hypothetical protein
LSNHFANLKFELFPFYEMINDLSSWQFFTSFVSMERFLIFNWLLLFIVFPCPSLLFKQEPQLTACEAFDVYKKPFSLWRSTFFVLQFDWFPWRCPCTWMYLIITMTG